MTYLTVSKLRQDPWIRDRVAACVAIERAAGGGTWISVDYGNASYPRGDA